MQTLGQGEASKVKIMAYIHIVENYSAPFCALHNLAPISQYVTFVSLDLACKLSISQKRYCLIFCNKVSLNTIFGGLYLRQMLLHMLSRKQNLSVKICNINGIVIPEDNLRYAESGQREGNSAS